MAESVTIPAPDAMCTTWQNPKPEVSSEYLEFSCFTEHLRPDTQSWTLSAIRRSELTIQFFVFSRFTIFSNSNKCQVKVISQLIFHHYLKTLNFTTKPRKWKLIDIGAAVFRH